MKKTMLAGFSASQFTSFLNQFSLIVLLAISLLSGSCTKEEVEPAIPENPVTPVEKLDPSNPANPFDYVGQQHNEMLDFIFTENAEKVAALQGDDFALQNLYIELATRFALENGYADANEFPLDHYLKLMTHNPEALIVQQPYLEYEPYLSAVEIPPHVRPWAEKLYAMLSGYPVENAESLPGFFKAIRTFEAEAMAALGTEESVIILVAASTARYSAAYWNDKKGFDGPQLFGWRESFFADAFGAGMGAAAGAAVGAAAGGAPSVPGAIIGGLIGGAVASAAFAG
jgi:hypothetical protein